MPIIYPAVPNLDTLNDLLAWPATEGPVNRIQIEYSATGGGAGYANIGSVTLVANTLFYTFYDVNGLTTGWYRWYFSNAANTFPISGSRDYSPEQQPSIEGAGLLVSVDEVKQELGLDPTDNSFDETILGKIREVSAAIQSRTGRQFARIPSTSTTTLLFDIEQTTDTLRIPPGIAQMTQLEVATISQPETGGVYTIIPTTDWMLRPVSADRDYGWPATSVCLDWRRATTLPYFYWGRNVVRATMALGFTSIPYDIKGIALRAVIRRYMGKDSGGGSVAVGPSGTEFLLPDMSGADRDTLNWYSVRPG